LGACDAQHCKRNQNGSYSVLLLLHIPFKMDACPWASQGSTCGQTSTSLSTNLPRSGTCQSAPGTAEGAKGVLEQCGQERFYRLGGGRTWSAKTLSVELKDCPMVPLTWEMWQGAMPDAIGEANDGV